MSRARFDEMDWQDDAIVIDGVRFHLYEDFWSAPILEEGAFWLFKGRPLIDEYLAAFRRYPDLDVRNIFELGIWETGSAAFWTQVFQPEKHIAIDLAAPREPAAFEVFRQKHRLKTRLKTFWQTNQADEPRVLALCNREFEGPLDLVLDDASHMLEPTKASFTTLFPMLRPGGLFIVEDWAWHFGAEVSAGFPPGEPGLLPLVNALLPLLRDTPELIARMDVRERLFVVERGPLAAPEGRRLLGEHLKPTFESGPPLLKRLIRGSVAWRLARTAVRGRR